MRTERWWGLGGFLLLSILIHILLAQYGPGFGLKSGAAPSAKEIELTLEPLPPEKKPIPPVKKPQPKVAKVVKVVKERPVPPKRTPKPVPKIAVKPVEEKPFARPVVLPTPQVRLAHAAPTVKPAVSRPARAVTPEIPEAAEPIKTASVTPHWKPSPSLLPLTNPLAGLAATHDKPQAAPTHSDAPRLTQTASAYVGLSGGASGGGQGRAHGPQMPTELPQESDLPGGPVSRSFFPRMAAHIGGESVMSVKNPLAEDAVPEEKPGLSSGGGLNGKMLASLRTGIGSGSGGGMGGGYGAGSGRGSGSGLGSGHGTGSGRSGSGSGAGVDLPGAVGDGYGRLGIGLGAGAGSGLRPSWSGSGGVFGAVGGLLRGEPARAPGDGEPGRNGHGLSAEIYEGQPYLTTLTHHRADATIDFNWGMTIPVVNGASRIFSVRWTGKIQPQYSETYTFASQEDDGLRLWIDGRPLINDWKDHKLTARRGSIPLEAGRKYDIKIEYFNGPDHAIDSLGHAEVHLRWTSPSQPLEIVPESVLWQAQ